VLAPSRILLVALLPVAAPARPATDVGTSPPLPAQATPLAVAQALSNLKSADWILKWAAMKQLARWKVKDAAPQLRAELAGRGHPWVRGRALVALAELLGDEMLAEAQARASDRTAELRAAAVEALGILGSPKAEATIAARLKDPHPQVRRQAVLALARVRGPDAWPAVEPILDDKDPVLVKYAARALVYIKRPEAHARAIALLDHASADVRAAAADTLGQCRLPDAIPALLRRMAADSEAKVRFACEKALGEFAPGALMLPALAALRGDRPGAWSAALRVLAARPCREAADAVAALIRKPNPRYDDVLPHAFGLLTGSDPDRYADVFAAYLAHPSSRVKVKAIEAISACAKADRFTLLRPLLLDTDRTVRVAVFRAVRELGDAEPPGGYVAYLAPAVQNGERWTLHAAIDLLCERVPKAQLPKVVELLSPVLGGTHQSDRQYAAKALTRVGNEDIRRRIAHAQGYVTTWMLLGPFPYNGRNRGFGPSYAPEYEIDFQKTYEPAARDPTAVFRVAHATCGGEKRKAILMRPPARTPARLVATFRVELPDDRQAKLSLAAGLEDGATDTDGATLTVAVGGKKLLERKLPKPEGWQAAEVPLAEFAGRLALIELSVDPLENPKNDRVAIAEPRVVSGDKVLASLLDLAESAPVRVAAPGAKNRLAWQRYRATSTDGEVALYDVYPPPIDNQIAYGVADVVLPRECEAVLSIKSDDGFVLWLNGAKLAERGGAGEQKAKATLRQGANRLLIKVFNRREWWRYSVRLAQPDGHALEFRQNGL